jgi:hypothetical protein
MSEDILFSDQGQDSSFMHLEIFSFFGIWDVLKKLTPSSQQAIAAEAIHA